MKVEVDAAKSEWSMVTQEGRLSSIYREPFGKHAAIIYAGLPSIPGMRPGGLAYGKTDASKVRDESYHENAAVSIAI